MAKSRLIDLSQDIPPEEGPDLEGRRVFPGYPNFFSTSFEYAGQQPVTVSVLLRPTDNLAEDVIERMAYKTDCGYTEYSQDPFLDIVVVTSATREAVELASKMTNGYVPPHRILACINRFITSQDNLWWRVAGVSFQVTDGPLFREYTYSLECHIEPLTAWFEANEFSINPADHEWDPKAEIDRLAKEFRTSPDNILSVAMAKFVQDVDNGIVVKPSEPDKTISLLSRRTV